jgi:hypothetical protein
VWSKIWSRLPKRWVVAHSIEEWALPLQLTHFPSVLALGSMSLALALQLPLLLSGFLPFPVGCLHPSQSWDVNLGTDRLPGAVCLFAGMRRDTLKLQPNRRQASSLTNVDL